MAIYNTPDGRQVVGSTTAGNDYHGFNGKRDIIIQLTANGATADGLNALEYLKAYAVEQNKQNNPIFPNGTRVWISANGYTKAVEADDIVIDGDNITIGGIAWNGEAWDFTNAGQTGSSLPSVTDEDDGKVLTVVDGAWQPASGGSGGGVLVVTDTDGTLDKTWQEIVDADFAVVRLEINDEEDPPPSGFVSPVIYHEIDTKMGDYSIGVLFLEDSSLFVQNYVASSASGYPER